MSSLRRAPVCTAGIWPSMGSVNDYYDNVLCKRIFTSVECELIDRRRFATKAKAGPASL